MRPHEKISRTWSIKRVVTTIECGICAFDGSLCGLLTGGSPSTDRGAQHYSGGGARVAEAIERDADTEIERGEMWSRADIDGRRRVVRRRCRHASDRKI